MTPGEAEDAAATLHHAITLALQKHVGMNESFAASFATEILRGLRESMGGDYTYIPAPDRTARNAAIRAEFNGRNQDELCRKYSISRSRLYVIVGGTEKR